MIKTKLNELIAQKNAREGRAKVNLGDMAESIGISRNTLYLWLRDGSVSQIHTSTLDAICRYFECGVGDILEYVPDPEMPQDALTSP